MTRPERPLAAARDHANHLWQAGQARAAIEEVLRRTWQLGRPQAEVVVAEQAAMARISAAGLDPSLVSRDVDELLTRIATTT